MSEIDDLNVIDASNTGRWPENMSPSAVNNAGRANEGILARWVQHFSGENFNAVAKTGVNTLTVSMVRASFTNSTTGTKYIDGFSLLVTIPSTLTGPAFLSINNHTKKPLIGPDLLTLSSSAILAGQKVLFSWDNDALSDVGGWQALTTIGRPVTADTLAPGTHAIWVPAAAMRPAITDGCSPLIAVETTALRPDMQVLDFVTGADKHAQFSIGMPSSWDEGTITYRAFWTSTATDNDGVSWALQGVACADGDTIDAVYGTAIVVDDLNQSTAKDLYVTDESAALTINGTPAAGELCFFQVFRDVSDGNDTADEDARLIGIQIIYTVDEAFDT